jgi:PKD repeat protein
LSWCRLISDSAPEKGQIYLVTSPAEMNWSNLSNISSQAFIRFILTVFAFLPLITLAQLSEGGRPVMPDLSGFQKSLMVIELAPPDINELEKEDRLAEGTGEPERMGVVIPVHLTTGTAGIITKFSRDEVTWSVNIQSKGATGLGLYFSEFRLPEGARMFVYSEDRTHILGAYTSSNNQESGKFAIEVAKGESIMLEYTCPSLVIDQTAFVIDEVLYVYKPMFFSGNHMTKDLNAGSCEVNTACSEGDNWRDEIKSVVRIQIKKGNAAYWCTGTVMNNTASDYSSLVLTADHCAGTFPGPYSSADDVSKWIFYFNYESPGCANGTGDAGKSMTGAVKLASSTPDGNNGSDFYLVLLNEIIPPSFEPFYAGWSKSGNISASGVSIHHPAGDVKKISTYTQPLTLSQWGQVQGTHFRVIWSATANGHGVTEGGSSGSPIFDEQGRVIGQLTGGESGCSNLTGPDYYGRLSYSWELNGTADSTRLKPWLDPVNTGLVSLNGSFNVNRAVARFNADATMIPVGSSVLFNDLSSGDPDTWHWEFEGGEPAESDNQSPDVVRYNKTGLYNVKLKVSNQSGEDSLVRENYIKVVPAIFPNPAFDAVNVMLGDQVPGEISMTVSNAIGQVVYEVKEFCPGEKICKIDLTHLESGFYFIRIQGNGYSETSKLLLIRN